MNGSDEAFETLIKYDFNTGLPRYATDANGQRSESQYDTVLKVFMTI